MLERLADNITIVAQTPDLDCGSIDVVVTIPTFRRPAHLLRTLESVHNQQTALRVAIIVMENEAQDRAGAQAASPLFAAGERTGLVIIAHDRGNCNAYNAGWVTALAKFENALFIAVIDDDELADPQWIEQLTACQKIHNVAFVGGPQLPVFEGNPPQKWRKHPVFTPHYGATGPVDILYSSGNLLLTTDVLRTMPRPFLDLAFNFTGGGDADFMRRAKAEGYTFAWCKEAAVRETIPENRVTRAWITSRALRNGQLSALIEHRARQGTSGARFKTIAHSLVLALASVPRAAIKLVTTRSVLSALYPIHIAAGRLASEFGYANEQYRNPQD